MLLLLFMVCKNIIHRNITKQWTLKNTKKTKLSKSLLEKGNGIYLTIPLKKEI